VARFIARSLVDSTVVLSTDRSATRFATRSIPACRVRRTTTRLRSGQSAALVSEEIA
jgi:hypothetical protein